MVRRIERRGLSLVEVALAVALFSICGVALISMMTHGAATAARASESQLASLLASRVMDRMLANGYERLAAQVGQSGQLSLPGEDGQPEPLFADGLDFTAGFRITGRGAGLVALVVAVEWKRPGTIGARDNGTFSILRYVTDPARYLDAR